MFLPVKLFLQCVHFMVGGRVGCHLVVTLLPKVLSRTWLPGWVLTQWGVFLDLRLQVSAGRKSTSLEDFRVIHPILLNCLYFQRAPRLGWGAGEKAWFLLVQGVLGWGGTDHPVGKWTEGRTVSWELPGAPNLGP